MQKVSNIVFLLLGVFVSYVITTQCNEPMPSMDNVIYVPGDSVPYVVYKDKPVPKNIIILDTIEETYYDTFVDYDTSYVYIDTFAVMKDFLSSSNYSDTLKNDSSAFILLNETVAFNKIQNRELIFQNKRKTILVTPHDNGIILGLGSSLKSVDFSLGYKYNNNIFNLSYSNNGIGFRYQYQIRF